MSVIYCVEDDTNIQELIVYTLNSTGFEAKGFGCAKDFFDAIKINIPDLVLLDIMLPDMDGVEIMTCLKKEAATSSIPIIMLTAKSAQLDKIKALDSGADDYITKPFDIMELISRIKALLRRTKPFKATKLTCGKITVDSLSRKVIADGNEVILTFKEFELLCFLMTNCGIVITRDSLMNKIWGTDFEGETRTVDVHIRTLRQKLGLCADYIKTIRNVGYKMENDNV